MAQLAVFGGTSPTGQLLLDRALAEDHRATAFVRSPGKLESRAGLEIVGGQLDDADAISSTVEGSDAVISVLGPTRDKGDAPALPLGIGNIIAAMSQHEVRRLVAIGTPSMAAPEDGRAPLLGLLVFGVRTAMRPAYEALVAMNEQIRGSGLDWTIVRVLALSQWPRKRRPARSERR